ncbi:MAG: hypothetical protein QOE14_999, partial [Humisphaera sp.]|nr:hypothetical protein [Humisphaera sp.]
MALHANWNDRSLLLWSGATAAELRDLVGQISSDALLASAAQEATLRLWLPQNGRLEASELSALKFSPAEAVDLLLSLPEALPAECGDSVRYWVALARFVTDCVRREKFYPIVRRPNAHHEAVWRLHLPSAEELDRLERFANSMPPSCRAIVGEEATALGLIDSFLTEAADALIRRAVSNDPFFTRVHGLAAEPGAGPEMRLLSAMLAPDRTVPGELRDNEVLADQVQLWSSRLGGAAPATGWQVAFTLHEPPEDVATPEQALWRVTFRLQPLGDGKPLDAARLWEDVSPLSPLGRQLPELRSLFLAELTRAAEVFTPLARVLASPAPVEVELLTVEANQFLRQWSVELRARSFAVELPSWADDTDRRLSLVMALRPSNGDGEFPNSNGGGGAG